MIAGIVILVLDDLIIYVFQNQKHLRVGYGTVTVCQKALEIKYSKIFVRSNGRRSIPDVGVPASGRKLRNIIHQRAQHGTDIFVIRLLKLRQHRIVKVIKNRIILRCQLGQVRLRRNAKDGVHAVHQIAQILQCVLVTVRQDLTKKLFQKLQMGSIASRNRLSALLVIIQCGNDLEGIDTTLLGIAHIDKLPVEVLCQLRIFILRIQNEYLGILRRQICQNIFGRKRFTGTGLAHDHHVGIDTFAVSAEKVQEYGNTLTASQLHAALIRNICKDPRISGSHRITRDSSGLLWQRIVATDLGADKCLHLIKLQI